MMTDMVNDRKEINEAIVAGDMALNSLYAAQEKLDSAKGWSWLDLFGGGFFTDMIKHSKIVFCKPFLHKIAKSFCRLLHLHFVGNCKTTAGSYSASHKPLQIIFSCYNTRYGNGSSEFSSSCACSLK